MLEWSVWSQTSLGSRARRFERRSDKRADYHEKLLEKQTNDEWDEFMQEQNRKWGRDNQGASGSQGAWSCQAWQREDEQRQLQPKPKIKPQSSCKTEMKHL